MLATIHIDGCMRSHMIQDLATLMPEGLEGEPERHRDIITIYCNGYIRGLMETGDIEGARSMLDLYPYLADEDWVPTQDWKWW